MAVYDGNENYIFVSYAHKDSGVVVPLVETLQRAGFRVWYDEGIELGSEWPEYIQDRLMGSSCVLACISPAAVESQFCRKELSLTISENKELLTVYLEETKLEHGLGLLIGNSQSLFRYNYDNDVDFLNALLSAPKLQSGKTGDKTDTAFVKDVKLPSKKDEKEDNPLVRRAFMFVEDKDWSNADIYFERILDSDPEETLAYLGKLMVEYHMTTPGQLIFADKEMLSENVNFQKIMRFGGDEAKQWLGEEAYEYVCAMARGVNESKKFDSLPDVIEKFSYVKEFYDFLLGREGAHSESERILDTQLFTATKIADSLYERGLAGGSNGNVYDDIEKIFSELADTERNNDTVYLWTTTKALTVLKEKEDYSTCLSICKQLLPKGNAYAKRVAETVFLALDYSEKNLKLPVNYRTKALDVLLLYKITDGRTRDFMLSVLESLELAELGARNSILNTVERLVDYGVDKASLDSVLIDNALKIQNYNDKIAILALVSDVEKAEKLIEQVRVEMDEYEKRRAEEEKQKRIAEEKKRAEEAKERAEAKARREQEEKERREAAEMQAKIRSSAYLIPIVIVAIFGIVKGCVQTAQDYFMYEDVHPWIFYFIGTFAVMSIISGFAGPLRKMGIIISCVSGALQIIGLFSCIFTRYPSEYMVEAFFDSEFWTLTIIAVIAAVICVALSSVIAKKRQK